MSSAGARETAMGTDVASSDTPVQQIPGSATSIPVEMTQTQGEPAAPTQTAVHAQPTEHSMNKATSSEEPRTPRGPVRTDTTTALAQALAASASTSPPAISTTSSQRPRKESTAIGPSTDQAELAAKQEEQSGPRLELNLLLTNGARHPFVIDAQYLGKRNVDVQGNDPFNLSVYKLKELILREWREEWEQKPSSPSYIRLISFGKLLDDKAALKDLKLNRTERNVIHMTIKPQDFVDEDDGKGPKSTLTSGRAGEEGRSPGCRCVIM